MKMWWNSLTKIEKNLYGGISIILLIAIFALLFDDQIYSNTNKRSGKPVGTVTFIERDGRYKSPDLIGWQPTRLTQEAYLGETYFTGAASSTKIKLDDGTEIVLEPNSMITLSKLGDQVNLNLEFGRVKATAAPQAKVKIQGRTIAGNFEVQKRELKKVKASLDWVRSAPAEIVHFDRQTSLDLQWTIVPEAESYVVEFSEDENFEVNVKREITRLVQLKSKSYPLSGRFFSRVIALGKKNEEIALSAKKSSVSLNQKSPTIFSPSEGENTIVNVDFEGQPLTDSTVTLKWSQDFGFKGPYQIQISDQVLKVKDSTYQLSVKKLGLESFRVRGLYGSREIPGPWSEIRKFNVQGGPRPELRAPEFKLSRIDHDSNIKPFPKLEWNAIPGIVAYEIQSSPNANFKVTESQKVKSIQLSLTASHIGEFYFRVRALTSRGIRGQWSQPAKVTLSTRLVNAKPVPAKIVLGKTPEDQGQPEKFKLSWIPNPGVKNYKVEISNTPEFKKKQQVLVQGDQTEITMNKPGELYWRVKPLDRQKRSIASFNSPLPIVYKLKVPLSQPLLTSKTKLSTVVIQKDASQLPINFSWKEVRQANEYEVQLADKEDFSNIIYQTLTPKNQLALKESFNKDKIFWRVRAVGDDERISNWSETGAFETRSGRIPSRWANGTPP